MPAPSVFNIRPATAADAPAMGRFGAMLVDMHHNFDRTRFVEAGPRTAAGYGEYLSSQLARPEVVVLVAEHADHIVGYSYGGIEGPDWMALRGPAGVIYDLIVDPDRRREGIGRRLLAAARSTLVAKGASRVLLFTAERNLPARAVFADAAFRPTMIEMTWDPPQEE